MPELGSHTHFSYNFDFISYIRSFLKDELEIGVLVEKSGGVIADFLPFRLVKNFIRLFRARLSGYGNFYIHYSFLSAFNASLIVKLLGGRVFYWNAGLPWLYKRNFLRGWFEKIVYRLIDYLVTGTEGLRNEYAKFYKLNAYKIKVLPNWINLEETNKLIASADKQSLKNKLNIREEKVLLFVHRLSKRKGAHRLPEILKGLKEEKIVLVIAGDGPERINIEKKFENLGTAPKVRFLGNVPHENILNYFAIADVFLMPSEEEGFPHALLEAMAAGVPFVATKVGGVAEITPPAASAYLVNQGDMENFIKSVRLLLHLDESEKEKLRRSLRHWAGRYDLKLVAEKFKNLFLN